MRAAVRRSARRGRRFAAYLALSFAALLVALAVTPPAQVTVFGQDVEVGAVRPSLSMGLSGPGEAELFGEGPVDTVQQFVGPVRPRIVWRSFNRDAAASDFIAMTTENGHRSVSADTGAVGEALARGWLWFFGELVLVAGIVGALLYLAGVALASMSRGLDPHLPRPSHPIRRLAVSVAAAVAMTAGSAALSVVSARDALSTVSTLADLTGAAPAVPVPVAVGPPRGDVVVAVVGDSTAAGVGNTSLADPTELDRTCGRSQDASARVLASATGLAVENLACSSATITSGLLGEQVEGDVTVPPQVGLLKTMTSLQAVVVTVGANDVGWSDFVQDCYGLSRCDDQVSESLMESRLDTFRLQYVRLLQQLADLPTQPQVIVTGYYDPFGTTVACPALDDPTPPLDPPDGYGFGSADDGAAAQDLVRARKIEPLRSFLGQLNSVLAEGASAFGFTSVTPSFAGHELCTPQPWVQGLSQPYPFHPNAAGELAIAAVQLPHLATLVAG